MEMGKTFRELGINAFPLSWPVGWKRKSARERSRFETGFAKARDGLLRELRLMGVPDWRVILSTNIPLRRDGLPYANTAQPHDTGVAVYFLFKGKPMVFACDTYIKVEDNLYAICKTVEAMRGIERWGASEMLERSFTGFQALPPPVRPTESPKRNWWEVLGVSTSASATEIGIARRKLLETHHPDRGGDPKKAAEINAAYDEGMRA